MSTASSTRDRLREQALKLFMEKGYTRTTIADIEEAAGLAPRTGGFYRHFESKAELAAEIGATSLIETRRDLGFDGVLPLGDTRAELVLIAKGYLRAADRQEAAARLLAEVRDLPSVRELEHRADTELLESLVGWLRPKKKAQGLSDAELVALAFTVFGGWLLYLSKRRSPALPPNLDPALVLASWANHWAAALGEDQAAVRDRGSP